MIRIMRVRLSSILLAVSLASVIVAVVVMSSCSRMASRYEKYVGNAVGDEESQKAMIKLVSSLMEKIESLETRVIQLNRQQETFRRLKEAEQACGFALTSDGVCELNRGLHITGDYGLVVDGPATFSGPVSLDSSATVSGSLTVLNNNNHSNNNNNNNNHEIRNKTVDVNNPNPSDQADSRVGDDHLPDTMHTIHMKLIDSEMNGRNSTDSNTMDAYDSDDVDSVPSNSMDTLDLEPTDSLEPKSIYTFNDKSVDPLDPQEFGQPLDALDRNGGGDAMELTPMVLKLDRDNRSSQSLPMEPSISTHLPSDKEGRDQHNIASSARRQGRRKPLRRRSNV